MPELSSELLAILRCPKCRGVLTERTAPAGLHCASCRLVYPIEDGIPNLLIDEARPDDGEHGAAHRA